MSQNENYYMMKEEEEEEKEKEEKKKQQQQQKQPQICHFIIDQVPVSQIYKDLLKKDKSNNAVEKWSEYSSQQRKYNGS